MAERIRFYLDVHVPHAVAIGLRRRGIDVIRVQEVGLADANDDEHMKFARREKRVLVTQDAGFVDRNKKGESHYGIAFCEQGSRSIGEMIAALALIYDVLEQDDMVGHVEYL